MVKYSCPVHFFFLSSNAFKNLFVSVFYLIVLTNRLCFLPTSIFFLSYLEGVFQNGNLNIMLTHSVKVL